jgi:hypothetical protein
VVDFWPVRIWRTFDTFLQVSTEGLKKQDICQLDNGPGGPGVMTADTTCLCALDSDMPLYWQVLSNSLMFTSQNMLFSYIGTM